MANTTNPPIIENAQPCVFDFESGETLISRDEVVCHAPSSAKSYAEERCNFLAMKEEKLFNKCFGWDFYIELMNDKVKYSMNPNDTNATLYQNFQENNTYSVGTHVLHKGRIYQVVQATTGVEKPPREGYFVLAKKFNRPEFDYLWKRYLCRLIAFSVMHTSVMYRLIKDTSKGVVKNFDEGKSVPASLNEMLALKDELIGDIDDFIEAMDRFMKRHPDCFKNYKALKKCAKGCTRRRKHYGFNTNRRKIG